MRLAVALTASPPGEGMSSYWNNRLYMPAALITIGAIWVYMEKRVPLLFKLIGVLVVAGLVACFGDLL
jgi:hypothetical protein